MNDFERNIIGIHQNWKLNLQSDWLLWIDDFNPNDQQQFSESYDIDLLISYPNIDIFLGGCLEELEAEAVGELLAPLVADDPLVLHVTLVPHQDHLRVVPAVRLDLGAPDKYVLKGHRIS